MMQWSVVVLCCALFVQRSASFSLTQRTTVDMIAKVDDGQKSTGEPADLEADHNGILKQGGIRSSHTVWIPSWPRAGGTTMFHMVLAAASEADFDADVVKALEDRGRGRKLFVPVRPPSEPGCWVLTPSGCHDRKFNATEWTRDTHAGPHTSRTKCEARRSDYNRWCKVKDAAVLFVPSPDYKASPIRRHFGLFEPCHQRYGNKTKPDIVAPELEGNCKLTMDKLFTCNFTGMEYLWGWSRPHSDITGVTSLGAMPPKFDRDLARRTCARSDLLVYKTIDEFGRNVSDVIHMLENHPHVKAVIPLRDPRAIYASWKELPWEFPGIILLKQICDQMAEDMDLNHKRLKRILLDRLIEKPTRVMRHVYEFLGLNYGFAQERWIHNTFNASCSETANEGNKFYSCHEDSEEPMQRWKAVLTDDEKQVFQSYPSCTKTAQHYGFEVDKKTWWQRHAWWFVH